MINLAGWRRLDDSRGREVKQPVMSRVEAWWVGGALLFMHPAVAQSWECHTNAFALGKLQAEFRTRSSTTEEGLPQNTINCLFQASDGYLWIGTRNGLARYDGLKFTRYDQHNTPALRSPDIQAVAENPPGVLWIGSRRGLARRLGHVIADVPLPLGESFVRSICARRAGGVWLATDAGPMRVQGDAVFTYTNYPPYHWSWDPAAQMQGVDAVTEDAAGDLWLRDPRGLVRLRLERNEFEIVAAPRRDEVSLYMGSGLAADRAGGIWFGWGTGLCRWREGQIVCWPRTGDGQTANGLRGEPGPLLWTQPGGLWFGDSWGGLSFWQDERFTHYRPPTGLSDEYVRCLLADREGTLWVGTQNGGLQRLQRRRLLNLTTADGLADNRVWSIAEAPDGSVWMATENGLSRLANGAFTTLRVEASDQAAQDTHNQFKSVVADSAGRVVAGNSGGLCQVQTAGLVPFCRVSGRANYPVPGGTLFIDKSGALWTGGDDLYRLKDGRWDVFVGVSGSPDPPRQVLSDYRVVGVLEDSRGDIWVGTKTKGVNRLRGEQCDWFTPTNGFPASFAAAALADPDGTVWFASDQGLIRGRDERFVLFTTEHGLFENLVLNVLEDDFGWLWLNGHRGLQRVRKSDLNALADGKTNHLECLHYGEADGMMSAEGNGGHLPNSCRTRDGRLWFPTTKGVVVVDPRSLNHNDAPPPVVIERVVADRETIYGDGCSRGHGETLEANPRSPNHTPELRLAPGRARSLVFHYTANSFVAPEHIRFRYKLEGHDSQWQEDNANLRTAFYTNLRPGAYRFRVVAFNNHNVPSEREAGFAFSLAPHFYETWPFQVLCAAAVLAAGGGLHIVRLRGLRRIQELEHQHALDRERARIARDMHDGLGADLTKIAVLADVAQHSQPDGPAPLNRVAALARGLVDSISELVWVTNPGHDTLESLVAYLREYASELLEASGIHARFDFPDPVPHRTVPGPVRGHLFFAVKESLRNALQHAHAAEIRLALAVSGDRVEINIADNGCGFTLPPSQSAPAPSQDRGHGLRHLRERVAAIHGECHIESEPGQGTRVRIVAPLK